MIQSKKYHRTIFVDQDGVILENVTYNRKIKKYESKGGIYELKFEKQENLSKKLDELIIQPYKILQFVRKKPIQTTLKF
jgi:hypothetical protein